MLDLFPHARCRGRHCSSWDMDRAKGRRWPRNLKCLRSKQCGRGEGLTFCAPPACLVPSRGSRWSNQQTSVNFSVHIFLPETIAICKSESSKNDMLSLDQNHLEIGFMEGEALDPSMGMGGSF